MLESVKTETLYRNIKTLSIYGVIALEKHPETGETMVVYGRMQSTSGTTQTRPIDWFKEKFEELK